MKLSHIGKIREIKEEEIKINKNPHIKMLTLLNLFCLLWPSLT